MVSSVSLGGSEDIIDDDDDDEAECRRYDRKQNTRDADDLRQSLRQRLVPSRCVVFHQCLQYFKACAVI